MESLWAEACPVPDLDVVAPVQSSASYGKHGELMATVELLERGFKVAVPVVDDDGVDLLVDYRVKVQVKRSARRLLEPVPGYRYPAYMWSNVGSNRTADFFILIGEGDEGRQWFVVPAGVIRQLGVKRSLTVYSGALRGAAATIARYEDAWHLFGEPYA